MTKKSVSRGKKQTNEQTQVSSKKLNIKKPETKSKKKIVIPKKCPGKSKPKEPKKVKVKTVNMEAPESSTETDIHHDSNDLSTKESERTVNMQTAPESSTETGIHNDYVLELCEMTDNGIKHIYLNCNPTGSKTYGQLLNHSSLHPNAVMKIYATGKNKLDVVFVAKHDITVDEEIVWDYGKNYTGVNPCVTSCFKC